MFHQPEEVDSMVLILPRSSHCTYFGQKAFEAFAQEKMRMCCQNMSQATHGPNQRSMGDSMSHVNQGSLKELPSMPTAASRAEPEYPEVPHTTCDEQAKPTDFSTPSTSDVDASDTNDDGDASDISTAESLGHLEEVEETIKKKAGLLLPGVAPRSETCWTSQDYQVRNTFLHFADESHHEVRERKASLSAPCSPVHKPLF